MAEMTPEDAGKRLLRYAVDRLGKEETAKRLNTTVPSIDAWLAGTLEPANRVVLALADLVYEMQKTAK